MSCYNFNTGMPDYSGRDGSLGMSGWQNWQRNMDNSGMGDNRMNSGAMNSGAMNSGAMNSGAMNSGSMNNSAMNSSNMNNNMNGFCSNLREFPLAMSYVPMQRWTQPLPIDRAMTRGTIFQELDLPFMMGRCR